MIQYKVSESSEGEFIKVHQDDTLIYEGSGLNLVMTDVNHHQMTLNFGTCDNVVFDLKKKNGFVLAIPDLNGIGSKNKDYRPVVLDKNFFVEISKLAYEDDAYYMLDEADANDLLKIIVFDCPKKIDFFDIKAFKNEIVRDILFFSDDAVEIKFFKQILNSEDFILRKCKATNNITAYVDHDSTSFEWNLITKFEEQIALRIGSDFCLLSN